jgi:hypothetical protein
VSPFPNHKVISADWSAHHRPVVEGTWTGACTIRQPGVTKGAFDDDTGTYETTPHDPHYTGKCRVQARADLTGQREAAGQQVTLGDYLVVVDLAESVQTAVGHVVKITAVDDNGDPDLVGRELTVAGVALGTLAWERDLACTDDQG